MNIIFSAIFLLFFASICESRRKTNFIMEEFKEIDTDVHDYDNIMAEDIWEYDVLRKIGVIKLNEQNYMEKVYNMKKGDKPWYICIVDPLNMSMKGHTNFIMKSLYFLQRDFP